ncbi:transmembrane protease serine 9-like [Uloborus diversus]|uniref:transmembrane protease serine 9-like n=1 Tax=Uloborus diversus TaxID=327109 RepID=UPI002408F626|nr:transmembrane protease serine 9-like [Uloborus diversus]
MEEAPSVSEESENKPDELVPRIVNGKEAREGEFPYTVALHRQGRFICTSFLISPNIVMTAAHCVQSGNDVQPASAFYGIIGNIRREGPDTRIEFSEVRPHPQYGDGTSEYDIAVFRTTQPVEYSNNIQRICLPAAGREFEGENVISVGWGVTSTEETRGNRVFVYGRIRFRGEELMGDSGGPLVFDDPSGRNISIGVTSFGSFLGCGRPYVPVVYTATSAYNDWLIQTVGEDEDICFV